MEANIFQFALQGIELNEILIQGIGSARPTGEGAPGTPKGYNLIDADGYTLIDSEGYTLLVDE